MLSDKGGRNFNQLIHVPLLRDYNSTVHVKDDQVDGVCHCALSVWWRFASELACEKTSRGKAFWKLLEHVRVGLHNPREALPFGLQMVFVALHPADMIICEHWIYIAATKVYEGLIDLEAYNILRVFTWAPCSACIYTLNDSSVVIPCSTHIHEGNRMPNHFVLIGQRCKSTYMNDIKELMLNMEARASNQEPCSSEPPEEVPSFDLIPKRHWCVICRFALPKIGLNIYQRWRARVYVCVAPD